MSEPSLPEKFHELLEELCSAREAHHFLEDQGNGREVVNAEKQVHEARANLRDFLDGHAPHLLHPLTSSSIKAPLYRTT